MPVEGFRLHQLPANQIIDMGSLELTIRRSTPLLDNAPSASPSNTYDRITAPIAMLPAADLGVRHVPGSMAVGLTPIIYCHVAGRS